MTAKTPCVVLLVIVTMAGGAQASAAAGGQPPPEAASDGGDMIRQLDRIEARIEQLEVDPDDRWLTDRRSREIRALISDLLADAEARSSLLQRRTAGWDDDFFIRSADGRFELELSGQLQQRYVWNRLRQPGKDDTRTGFEVRRAKVKLKGYIMGPDVGYTVGTALNNATGAFELQYYNIRFRVSDELMVFIGLDRPPLLREEFVSSKRQLAAERSLVTRTFRQRRTLGVMLRYETDRIRLAAGLMDSAPGLFGDQSVRVSTRLDVLVRGGWEELKDFTSFPDDKPLLAVGGGILFENDDKIDPAADDVNLVRASADVSLETGGANAFVAIVLSHVEEENQPTRDQVGFVIQGGVFVVDGWEVFGRYEWGDADGEAVDLSVLTIGFNRYFDDHQLKWTTDIGYGLNEIGGFWSSDGAGYRTDDAGQDGQIVVRGQLQLLF